MKCLVINFILSLERYKKFLKLTDLTHQMMDTIAGTIMLVAVLPGSTAYAVMKNKDSSYLVLGVLTPINLFFI